MKLPSDHERLRGLTGSALDHRSLPPDFEFPEGCFIFDLASLHLTVKSGRKTPVNQNYLSIVRNVDPDSIPRPISSRNGKTLRDVSIMITSLILSRNSFS